MRVLACLDFASGRIGVTAAQALLLEQSGCGVPLGQSMCKPQACAAESIDSTRSMSEQLHTCRDKRQFALNSFVTLLLDPNAIEATNEEAWKEIIRALSDGKIHHAS